MTELTKMFSTSNLLENKQAMHVVAEVVVLIGVVYYINQKNAACVSSINKLVQRIEEQEDIIQRHEQIITKLVETLNQMSNSSPTTTSNSSRPISARSDEASIKKKIERKTKIRAPPPPQEEVVHTPTPPRTPPRTPSHIYEDDNSESEDDIEEELDINTLLAEELRELDDNGEADKPAIEILDDNEDSSTEGLLD